MKEVIPLRFIVTGEKRENGDNRELEVFLYTKNKEQQVETIKFLKKYLKIERKKDVLDKHSELGGKHG